jgi:hypothetical protein
MFKTGFAVGEQHCFSTRVLLCIIDFPNLLLYETATPQRNEQHKSDMQCNNVIRVAFLRAMCDIRLYIQANMLSRYEYAAQP